MPKEEIMRRDLLTINSVIQYTLPLSQYPVHPHKLWRGKITAKYDTGIIEVESLEPGYEGLSELVYLHQIRSIESRREVIC
jgi:hypothetical protein